MKNEKDAKKVSALSVSLNETETILYVRVQRRKKWRAKLGIENDWNSMRNINRTFIHSHINSHKSIQSLVHNFFFGLLLEIRATRCFFFSSSTSLGARFVVAFFFYSIPCAQYQWNTIVVAHETPTFRFSSRFTNGKCEIVEMFIIVVNTQFISKFLHFISMTLNQLAKLSTNYNFKYNNMNARAIANKMLI